MSDLLDFICGADSFSIRALLGFFVFVVCVDAIVLLCKRMGGLVR